MHKFVGEEEPAESEEEKSGGAIERVNKMVDDKHVK